MTYSPSDNAKFETLCLHKGLNPAANAQAAQVPIYQTSSFVFEDIKDASELFALQKFGNIYSRLTNPTVGALQERLAAISGGVGATVTSSGHAAQLVALFNLLQPGDHIVVSDQLYGGSITQFSKSFKQFGWEATFVNIDEFDAVRNAITDKTKALFVESISNPGGAVGDLEALSGIAHSAGIPLIVDNTIATPYLCQPFQWGADIIVYSTTKFLSGNGSAIGGAIVDNGKFDWTQNDKFPLLAKPDSSYHGLTFAETFGPLAFTVRSIAVGLRDLGCCQSPFNAFLTLNGIETLPLRVEKHAENGLRVAKFLENHPAVAWVSHSGLASSKYYKLRQKYLPQGTSSVFTFGVKGGHENGKKLVESTQLFIHLANVGDARSLILHPASTSHSQLTDEQKQAAGAGPDVIRLSVGLEHADDIIADLDQALNRLSLNEKLAA